MKIHPHHLTYFLFAFILYFSSSCTNPRVQNYKVYFFTTMDTAGRSNYTLYINNKSQGDLPYRSPPLTCNNNLNFISLPPGQYNIQAKSKQGNLQNSARLILKREGGYQIKGLRENSCTHYKSRDSCLVFYFCPVGYYNQP